MKKISKALEDYLETIYILELENKPSQITLIAEKLDVSKPACTKAMNRLIDKKYILKKPYGEIFLTYEGRNIAKNIYYRHTTIKKFLLSIGINEHIAENDCCNIEHVISEQTLKALAKFTKK